MNKKIVASALLLLSVFAQAETEQMASIHEGQRIAVSGFDCANDSLNVIPLLGRGTNFPQFIVADVETELERQNKGSQLISISCTGKATLEASQVPMPNEPDKSMISGLSMTFPIELEVTNEGGTITLTIEQNYSVEGLDSDDIPRVTQNFVVKNQ